MPRGAVPAYLAMPGRTGGPVPDFEMEAVCVVCVVLWGLRDDIRSRLANIACALPSSTQTRMLACVECLSVWLPAATDCIITKTEREDRAGASNMFVDRNPWLASGTSMRPKHWESSGGPCAFPFLALPCVWHSMRVRTAPAGRERARGRAKCGMFHRGIVMPFPRCLLETCPRSVLG